MNSERIDRMMGEAMGPEAPLTRAEERAALAGTLTLIAVAAIAMLEILFSRAPLERPPGRPAWSAHASPAAHARPAPPTQSQAKPMVPQDTRPAP
jgi:hypothetical protein